MAGLIIMFIMVAFAVAIFISCGGITKQFDFLETENIETEYGVTGMVKERKAAYKETYTRNNVMGTCFAILSVVPLFGAYWILITAVYLAVSLPNDNWDETWIIWPVAALIFAAWRGIAAAVVNRKNS